jgi:hypothetical protein
MRTSLLLPTAALVWCSTPLLSQSTGDLAAYLALIETPAAALTPLLTNTLVGPLQRSPVFALRYGYLGLDGASYNNFGVSAVLPAGIGSSVSLNAGVFSPSCRDPGCDNQLMLSIGGDTRLLGTAIGQGPNPAKLLVALNGELGYGKPRDANVASGMVGLPVSLVAGDPKGMRVVPFLTPAFGFGRVSSGSSSESGTRLVFGGGVGVHNTVSSLVVNLGFQHVYISGAKTLVGVNVMFGGR